MLILCRAWSPSELTVEYWSMDRLGSAFLTLLQCSPCPLQWNNQPLHWYHPFSTPEATALLMIAWSVCHYPELQGKCSTDCTYQLKHHVSFHSPARHLPWLFSFLQRKLTSNYFTIWTFLGPCQDKGKLASKVCDSSLFSSSAYEPAFCLTGSSLD